MLGEIRSLGEVLAQQTIGVFVTATLPGAFWITEVDIKTGIDLELDVLCHLRSLIPGQGSA